MKKNSYIFIPILLLILGAATKTNAQYSRYIIQFKDKGNNSFTLSNPAQYLSQRAITRRAKYNIAIDSFDLPITAAYLDSIRSVPNVTILNSSKWLNMVCIQTNDATALTKINSFPFIVTATASAARPIMKVAAKFSNNSTSFTTPTTSTVQASNDFYNYGLAYPQIHLHNGEFLHNHGFRGDKMILTILDAGFYHYQSLPSFDSARNNNQIINTWNFVANNLSVNEDATHGMECLSTIAANIPGQFVGTAPKANYYLYVTEDSGGESVVEELNLADGAEHADSVGADVVSVSLGYTTFDNNLLNHTYADMNGKTTMAARAVDFAAQKGILVVCAAGNDGQNSWHYIGTPADADSNLTVGAVNIYNQSASFSSYGYSSDGRVKPNVAAVGSNSVIASYATGMPSYGSGTSYATPIMAGITTCLWQAFPEVNNMTIIDALQKSADHYSSPDNRVGYGTPDAKKAFVLLIKQLHTQNAAINNCSVGITFTAKCAADMNFTIERKLPTDSNYLPIEIKNGTDSFTTKTFTFLDDLSFLSAPANVLYRIKMTIASDTSFYLDSAALNYTQPCPIYVFTGNGNWTIASNWLSNVVPPAVLPAGSKIVISPIVLGNQCILNIPSQKIAKGAIMIINSGKKIRLPQNLIIN